MKLRITLTRVDQHKPQANVANDIQNILYCTLFIKIGDLSGVEAIAAARMVTDQLNAVNYTAINSATDLSDSSLQQAQSDLARCGVQMQWERLVQSYDDPFGE